jgi:hypothetical protein
MIYCTYENPNLLSRTIIDRGALGGLTMQLFLKVNRVAYLILLGLFATLFLAQAGNAALVNFQTATKNAMLGSTVSMEILFSGYTDNQLGSFDLEVGYNSDILGFNGIVFGDPDPTIGDQLNTDGNAYKMVYGPYSISPTTSSGVNLIERASMSPPTNLGEYILATISFSTIGVGLADLWINVNSLLDFSGNDLKSIYAGIGQINVTSPPPPAVPIPAAAWLLGTGLIGLVAIRRKLK